MHRLLLWILACCLLQATARARQEEDLVRIELRALSEASPGRIVIDRGERDGLAVGDLVTFMPRSGNTLRGNVLEVSPRSAIVELFDKAASVPAGTPGEVKVPASRVKVPAVPPPAAPPDEPVPTQDAQAEPTHEGWEKDDGEWKEGMPLLAQIGVVRPSERATSLTGTLRASGDQTFSNDDGRSSGFYRLGTTMDILNSFGRGDGISLDLELNYRNARNPDGENDDSTHLRLDELSYWEGGTRFESRRWEAGRFLQNGMPEFGYLDGFEWGQRLRSGDTWGASVGFIPEPTPDRKSGEDVQFAGFYRWISDSTEQLSATAGYQKSFHNGDSDRDLLVTRVDWLPTRGWNFLGTAWVDFYNGGDTAKDSSAELTLARLSTSRRWDDGDSMDVTLSHQRYADLERFELAPVAVDQLTDDHYTRLAMNGGHFLESGTRLHGGAGGWVDQEDAGGDLEAGLEFKQVFAQRDSLDTTWFVTAGKFSDVAGTRLTWGRFTDRGRWDLFYEVSFNRVLGFDEDRDDILQHWLGVNGNLVTVHGWSISLHAESRLWDDFNSWNLGFYTQKSF